MLDPREQFVSWLATRMTKAGRGDDVNRLDVSPSGKFWLGRLQSDQAVMLSNWGDRGERLEPCSMGIKVRPAEKGPWEAKVIASFCAWIWDRSASVWNKTERSEVALSLLVPYEGGSHAYGQIELEEALESLTGSAGLCARVDVEVESGRQGPELTFSLVNCSPPDSRTFKDTRLYECRLAIGGIATRPFLLEALEDSFRYDRRVDAYGVNCGVTVIDDGWLATEDAIEVDRFRPKYWSVEDAMPSMMFLELGKDPFPPMTELLDCLKRWGEASWGEAAIRQRSREEDWSAEMLQSAQAAAQEFDVECMRVQRGIELLREDASLLVAFKGMNRAMQKCAQEKYDSWRPFQLGFLLANMASIVDTGGETNIVDVVWFATGGGKTETYLGLLITAALYDRLKGKTTGVSAWSRFPLRMLSLQQTQRFSDAVASAECIRQEINAGGEPFSLGFFVGQGATPNRIQDHPKAGEPDPDDEAMPARYRVLERCPFCRSKAIAMRFDRRLWKLDHVCGNDNCPWTEDALPIYVVDEEIYRFLPTIIVGTLDKAASISMQAAMRGLVGAPRGLCSREGHGFVYSPRSTKPNGCMVPGCTGNVLPLPMSESAFGPSFRLQDELHLLRDSLGAVASHYEALYDDLQQELCGRKPKILASSATLTGYERQVDVLYRRAARVFPVPPPAAGAGFWTSDSEDLMRRFVAIAPRGVTIEYTVDRLLTELQVALRLLAKDPDEVCQSIGIDPTHADDLLSLYGTDIVYGNTLRDLEAVTRSMETQVLVDGSINTASLTGKTDFADVRNTLSRLENPEASFADRLHIISASSMMSHGVDIDRMNIMVMLGLPLAAAEFIQATARVGRRYPGLVFVIHKIGRERDAGVYRSFRQFVEQGDRFVEPVPVTKHSRRVLDRTIAGLALARILMVHEAKLGLALTTVAKFKQYAASGHLNLKLEYDCLVRALDLTGHLDEPLRRDMSAWYDDFRRYIDVPPPDSRFISDLSPTGSPMLSLRDVEQQVPIIGNRI